MVEEITTIKLNKKTKSRLDKLKIHKRESYEELMQKILSILNVCKVNPYEAKSRLSEIDKLRESLNKQAKQDKN